MNNITVEAVHDMTRKQFAIAYHPEKRLQTTAYPNGSNNMPVIVFVGICARCKISPGKVCEFLRIEMVEHNAFLNKFESLIEAGKQTPPIKNDARKRVHMNLPDIAFRKAKLVRNFLRTKYRIEVEV